MSDKRDDKRDKQRGADQPPPAKRTGAEWTAFGVAAAILLAVLGAVGYLWADQGDGEPQIEISQAGEIRQRGDSFYVPFEVRNLGGATAAEIQLEAELTGADGEPEPASQQIGFLAGGETERGAFVFSSDPRQGELTLRVAGYLDP
ncbi:MAG TPA: TIGR02588 family protein [Herpetosiphonaceae bacterium]